jgi:hypothetical protein
MAIIDKPTDYFNTVLWSGNATNRDITGVGFQPDFTWIKNRSAGYSHVLGNSLSGDNKFLGSNSTSAESTDSDKFRTFVSDGIQVGTHNGVNASGSNYVGWNWKANGSGSLNEVGDIDSTVSVNTTSGFSIVSYTGTGSAGTVGHGLGSAPKMVICKTRSTTGEWITWHTEIDIQAKLSLNTTDAVYNPGTGIYWNSTLPTSSVFSVGTSGSVNGSGTTYIAYCFAEKQGYSKFGSYTGNGDADGTFVYTGFKPAFTLIKRTDSATGGSWILFDNKRGTNVINPVDVVLAASNDQTEADWGTTFDCDYLSNGFKWRFDGTAGYNNASGATYIYMAFASEPFTTSTGVPATAR